MISPNKQQELKELMASLDILEEDLEEKFVLGSGKGGQKVNKTHSCVYIKHRPTGIEVKCQQDRSREINRFLARRQLCEAYCEHSSEHVSKKQKEIEKIRKQKQKKRKRQQQ